MQTHIFGIRHHGPGSARHVLQALTQVQPDIILIEGPAEAAEIISWAVHQDMEPPVAILAYALNDPNNALFYPFAEFSPEWQAIQFGLEHKIPIRFIDMPLTHTLAFQEEKKQKAENIEGAQSEKNIVYSPHPFAQLAKIAGFEDEEEWWEQFFEFQHDDACTLFIAIKEMVKALREQHADPDRNEQIREAFMRYGIRQAQQEMYESIAVICGAWHAPALDEELTAKKEKELLQKLPKTKVACTWIPWSHEHLMYTSGYGAGVTAPGWYMHLWEHTHNKEMIWLSKTAEVFRKAQFDISPAHVIEATNLLNALCALRNKKHPGLEECREATISVMLMGETLPLALLYKELIVGHKIGKIPVDAPLSPLQKDFESQSKSLRLKIQDVPSEITLDLRAEFDLRKSAFLHQLNILGIFWGTVKSVAGKGTFKEGWDLRWEPEMMIALVEKSKFGNSINEAAEKYILIRANETNNIHEINLLIEKSILADMQAGTQYLLKRIDQVSAAASDVLVLMQALPPLANIIQYGDVRKTDTARITEIFTSIFRRMIIGLPVSCNGIDENASKKLATLIEDIHRTLHILEQRDLSEDWLVTLQKISQQQHTTPFINGTLNRLLHESQVFTVEQVATNFSKALSAGNDVSYAAQWVEGFLFQAGTSLIFDDTIWQVIYNWVSNLEEETFISHLPLLRRTFSTYSKAEREKIAHKAKHGAAKIINVKSITKIDPIRADKVNPIIEKLLQL